MALIRVRVSPGARRDEIVGWRGDTLRVRVRAAPEKGRANEAVATLIAAALAVPARTVTVEHGHTSREKVLLVEGVSEDEITRRLGKPLL
jgi:uncharacterized protein (TIGR00251 family)